MHKINHILCIFSGQMAHVPSVSMGMTPLDRTGGIQFSIVLLLDTHPGFPAGLWPWHWRKSHYMHLTQMAPYSYAGHYFWPRPMELWSKVVHIIGNKVLFGTQSISCLWTFLYSLWAGGESAVGLLGSLTPLDVLDSTPNTPDGCRLHMFLSPSIENS